jgi:hypothetical protein
VFGTAQLAIVLSPRRKRQLITTREHFSAACWSLQYHRPSEYFLLIRVVPFSFLAFLSLPFLSLTAIVCPMRAFWQRILNWSSRLNTTPPIKQFHTSNRMSSTSTAAALYAATVSFSTIASAVPEDIAEKKHHLKDGKGFHNPWDSWHEMGGPAIGRAMLMYEA